VLCPVVVVVAGGSVGLRLSDPRSSVGSNTSRLLVAEPCWALAAAGMSAKATATMIRERIPDSSNDSNPSWADPVKDGLAAHNISI
jgi:hypothetical protein